MSFLLSIKRIVKKPAIIVMLCITFVCILLCGMLSEDDGIPNCGVVSGSDKNAVIITDWLERDGLVRYESTEALKKGIERGEVASGIVFPDDFTERLERTDTDDMLIFYEAPTAVFRSLYKFRTAAYIMDVYAPYLLSRLVLYEGAKIPYEKMRAEIDEYIASDDPFEFTFENAEGAPMKTNHYSFNLTAGVVSLFLFFAFGLFAMPYTEKQFLSIAKRVGFRKAFAFFALPSLLCVIFLFFATSALALWLSDILFSSGTALLIGRTAVYALFLSALGIAVNAVFGNAEKVRVPIMAICLLSIALCPIFVDIPALIGLPDWIRYILPTMFFYAADKSPLLCAAIAACAFCAALWLYTVRFKTKMQLK